MKDNNEEITNDDVELEQEITNDNDELVELTEEEMKEKSGGACPSGTIEFSKIGDSSLMIYFSGAIVQKIKIKNNYAASALPPKVTAYGSNEIEILAGQAIKKGGLSISWLGKHRCKIKKNSFYCGYTPDGKRAIAAPKTVDIYIEYLKNGHRGILTRRFTWNA